MTEDDLHDASIIFLPLAHLCIVLLLIKFKPGKLITFAIGIGGLIVGISVGYMFYFPQEHKAYFGFNPTVIYFMPYIEQALVFLSVSWMAMLITGKSIYCFVETFEGLRIINRHYPMDWLTLAAILLIPAGNVLIVVQAAFFHHISLNVTGAYLSLAIPVLLYGAMFVALYAAVQTWARFLERHQVPESPAPVQHEHPQ